jgi:hypothetical protein
MGWLSKKLKKLEATIKGKKGEHTAVLRECERKG